VSCSARDRIPEPSPTPDTAATPELVHVRPYLSAEQLCALTPWTPDALEKLVRRGVLKRGVHYFQPFGRRGRLFFKWSAIVALIEGLPVPSETEPVVDKPRPALKAIPTRRATIDVEKATTDLQRLLS
jgi:hypothetical protein